MNPDKQRIILLLGLFIVGYLLLLAWDDDYGSVTSNTNQAPSNPVDTPIPSAELISDTPPTINTPTAPDVPAFHQPATITPKITPNQDLIKVETDTYEVWINLLGGDLVRIDLKKFPVSLDNPNLPVRLLEHSTDRLYIAQSGLRAEGGPDWYSTRPQYLTTSNHFVLADGEQTLTVPLVWNRGDGLVVRKVYQFQRDHYKTNLFFEVTNNTYADWHSNVFAQIKRDNKAPTLSSGVSFAPQAYTGAAFTTHQDRYLKIDFDDLDEQDFNEDVKGGWVAMLQHYFLSAWVPDANIQNRYYGKKQQEGVYLVGLLGPPSVVPAGEQRVFNLSFYSGPKLQSELVELAENIDLTVDYGFLWWLSQPLFWLLKTLYQATSNWGLAIIFLTFIVKIILFPLSAAAYRSMANMRHFAPDLKRLQERYADDRQRLSQEMMGFYKKKKINPLGGCIPMLLQMPVFLALYWVLYESVELRQAPFALWIVDLSIKDPWFVLPILMGLTMYLQQFLNPPIPDPVQARIIKFMPVIFTALFLLFPSGLVLYWLTNNVLSILQQHVVNKKYERLLSKS